ncbi:hypothetical protein ABEB36_001357 [Hypothenemus hampei]|uniref:G-protein coupled receptors family 1 profile domain-containing protein n=1 Tax=Hypothenemus hampei TaxID=57062 RepID=A0ABD1FEB6_HYPHA
MSDDEYVLGESRFWFQKVIVPIMVCVGVMGNTITVMVLTRRRMRSSTNIYLSALGIADIIYLFFVFLLSFKHYDNIHDPKYVLYWRFYGLIHWLCDAASSTSVWLTVSFTIERYIAVCHPIKGKFFCTENRAKTVVYIVYIFCILTTASTAFEYQLNPTNDTMCNCSSNDFKNPNNLTTNFSSIPKNQSDIRNTNKTLENLLNSVKKIMPNCTTNHAQHDSNRTSGVLFKFVGEIFLEKASQKDFDNGTGNNSSNGTLSDSCCDEKNNNVNIDVEKTYLGKNHIYVTVINWYSSLIWGLIPLVLIATFNCFLVRAVYISQGKRKAMTRTNSQNAQLEHITAISNENRITIMLIAVVVMFLICQTPTASFLIYYSLHPAVTQQQKNIESILGNVFNSLLAVNASCNFLFYSIISKRFRSTFRKICFEKTRPKRQDTMPLTSLKRQSNSSQFKRNTPEYLRTPRNLETASLTSVPRTKPLINRPLGKARSTDLTV